MSPWLVVAVWAVWFLLVSGLGYAHSSPADREDRRATAVSVWADLVTVIALAGGVVAAVAVPSAALPWDSVVPLALGSAMVALGLALRQWAVAALGDSFTRSVVIRGGQRMVTSGPYRVVRHPAYAGNLISTVGLALTLGNWLSVVLVVTGSLLATVRRIRAEDAALEAGLGEQYREVARRRRRLVPGIW